MTVDHKGVSESTHNPYEKSQGSAVLDGLIIIRREGFYSLERLVKFSSLYLSCSRNGVFNRIPGKNDVARNRALPRGSSIESFFSYQ
jgi:hypothetical protein